ncbi:MAG: hypothetical protein CMP59_05240 [Flavobacteriales bacterium]|nr:hypothetical protein [Flavobacteriales bacterium]|tara:strand:+ start:358 stop:1008 length:651 start_codon:yes stop_codon:yes gene_type:complete
MIRVSIAILLIIYCSITAFAQENNANNSDEVKFKYRISTPIIAYPQYLDQPWNDKTNTQHFELHIKRDLDNKNIFGVKLATWRLFQPMGIQWGDGLLDKVDNGSEYYPGWVRESGIGVSYQRMLWKGLFSTVEVLPLFQTYLDEDNKKIDNGFKLYTSVHIGYHIAFGKSKRFFIEPQVHGQFWIDTEAPEEFKTLDDKWADYFLFEPNLYVGVKF